MAQAKAMPESYAPADNDSTRIATLWQQCNQTKDYDHFLEVCGSTMWNYNNLHLYYKPFFDTVLQYKTTLHNTDNLFYLYHLEDRIHMLYHINDTATYNYCVKSRALATTLNKPLLLFLAYSDMVTYYEEMQLNPIKAQENLQLMEDGFDKMSAAEKDIFYKSFYVFSSVFYYYIEDYEKSIYYLNGGYHYSLSKHDTATVLEFLKRRSYFEVELKQYTTALNTVDTAFRYIHPGSAVTPYIDKLNSRRFIILNRTGHWQDALTVLNTINTTHLENVEYYNHEFEAVQLYINLKQYDHAQELLNSLYPITKNRNADYTSAYQKMAYQIYKGKGQMTEALAALELYKTYNDSLQNISRQKAAYASEIKYQAHKKEEELALRNAELKAERQNRLFIASLSAIIILLLLICIGIVFINALRQKEKLQKTFSEEMIAQSEKIYENVSIEIHDELGQDMALLRNTLNEGNYLKSQNIAINAIEKVRRISRSLYPAVLKHLGLKEALKGLLERIDKTSPIFINYDIQYDGGLDRDTELQIYRIAQEALTNAIKHSGAVAIQFAITTDNKYFYAHIKDNGKGFDVKAAYKNRDIFGLMNMTHRAELIGYKLTIESAPGKGTLVKLQGHLPSSGAVHDRKPENNNR